jgi:hypothetical protein
MKKTYGGRELDAPWRGETELRIAKHRKGKWTIVAQDKTGKALPGAKDSIRMKRHLFGFGSSVDPMMLSGLDAKMPPLDQQRYVKVADELFSRIVPENRQRPRNGLLLWIQNGPGKKMVADAIVSRFDRDSNDTEIKHESQEMRSCLY